MARKVSRPPASTLFDLKGQHLTCSHPSSTPPPLLLSSSWGWAAHLPHPRCLSATPGLAPPLPSPPLPIVIPVGAGQPQAGAP